MRCGYDMRDDVIERAAAAELDRGLQDDDRHGAVDVVIPVDEDWLFAFDRGVEAIDGGAQASHLFRRVEMSNRRRQKTLRRIRVSNSTTD
jgi:hypothetical protein